MKGSILNKINTLRKLAQASSDNSLVSQKKSAVHDDSLSKAIKNKKDADIFLAELETAIKIAQSK